MCGVTWAGPVLLSLPWLSQRAFQWRGLKALKISLKDCLVMIVERQDWCNLLTNFKLAHRPTCPDFQGF